MLWPVPVISWSLHEFMGKMLPNIEITPETVSKSIAHTEGMLIETLSAFNFTFMHPNQDWYQFQSVSSDQHRNHIWSESDKGL